MSRGKTKPIIELAITELCGVYVRGAKSRKKEFVLTDKQVRWLIQQNCHYCGASPRKYFRKSRYGTTLKYNGIDRKDNTLPYTQDNCVSCCYICNLGKHTISYKDFILYLNDVVTFHKKVL